MASGHKLIAWYYLAATSALIAQPRRAQGGESDPLPSWNYAEAAAVVRNVPSSSCSAEPAAWSLLTLRLLAWRTFEQDPRRQEEALWWAEIVTRDGPEWILALTFRATDKNGPQPWRFTTPRMACHRRGALVRRFAATPTGYDAVDLLSAAGATLTSLPFGVDPGDWLRPTIAPANRWFLREARVREKVWQEVFRKAPPEAFSP